MRIALIAALVIALTGTADAQSRGGRAGRGGGRPAPTPPTSSVGLPLPQIGLPLPTIGLPLPPMGLSQPRVPSVPVPSAVNRFDNRFDRRFDNGFNNRPDNPFDLRPSRINGGPHRGLPRLIYGPTLGWPYLQEAYPYQDPYPSENPFTPEPLSPPLVQPEELQPTGGLDLELQPGVNPQIYVDGYFVASLSDVGDELILDAGPHAVELHQDGFQTLRIDVQVPRDRVVTYRDELKPLNAPPAARAVRASTAPAPAPARTTIYVIPGCYVGNVAPASAKLPAGCDARDAVAFPSR